MAKFSLSDIQTVLRKTADETTTQKVLVELQKLESAKDAAKEEKPPAEKKTLTVIRPDDTTEIAWVIAHPESLAPALVPGLLREAAFAFNSGKKAKLLPVASLGAALEDVPAKYFKEHGLTVKTKLPVDLIATGRGLELSAVESAHEPIAERVA